MRLALGDRYNFLLESDGLPNAVQYYLLYAAALIHGAVDAKARCNASGLGDDFDVPVVAVGRW
jgi:hypothetical protein